MFPLPTAWTYETGLPPDTGISGFWDSTVPISCRTGEDTVHSSIHSYGSEEPISVTGCYTSTFDSTDRPEAEHADQPDMQGTFYTCICFLMHPAY